ncbi:Transcriptional regulator ATRX [Fasciola gigantica]|uniref:Transcriptional regulator ATRX n=1 Tax=Fasciola gigantica TaxID=46835 RepID=A0A504YVN0_FASGI|nr:Transcriptional regulator ATRX [Fasciola gigantica]
MYINFSLTVRRKQLAIRTTFEEDVTLNKRSASLDGAVAESPMATKDVGAGAPSVSGGVDPVYQFDSSGTATLQDGTVVVQPVSADTVSVPDGGKGIVPTNTVANIPAVKCTVCGMEMDPATSLLSIHPILQVIRCLPCAKFYRKQEFLRDSDGKDENCRWCADGGDLICCDHCPNAFCKRCIKRNLGRCALSNIESLDESAVWTCYVCDPSPIQSLRALCSEVLIKVDELKALRRRRSERAHASWKTRCVSAPKVSFPVSPNTVSGCTSTSTPTAGSNETLKALTSIFSQLSQSVSKPGSQTDTSGLPDMNNLLQIMGQTLSTNNVNSNVSGPTAPTIINPSLPVTPPGWVLRNATTSHPTALSRCLVVNNQPNASVSPNTSVNVSVPSVSTNSEISAILNQITSVNESNVRIALKAARRCIETFSADIRRLEQMSAKASSINDLGRVVRSFHSIYRFHLFARLSNLSARMREEMPKAPEKLRALTTLQPATKSTSLFVPVGSTSLATVLSVPATLPSGLTIDLTDEFDRNRESSNPNSNQSVPEDMKSAVEEFKTTESGTRLSSSALSPIISGAAVPVHNPVERDRKASSMSPAPKSPTAESVTVPTTSLTVSQKTSPVPSSVTVPPESTPSSSLPEKPCKLEPSADANARPSEVSEPNDAHPEPKNRGETDDLGPVDDEDDDDDIDWKLDMLANLSQSETPKLIFTPNNQVENNNAQCAAGTVDSHSPRQSDIDPPDVSSGR